MTKPISLEDLAAIFMAGGRNFGEKSKAMPQQEYQDPAKHIKFEREQKTKGKRRK